VDLREYIKKQERDFPEKFRSLLKSARLKLIVEIVVNMGIELSVVLEEILSMDEDVKKYEKTFFEESGIKISFEERAVDQLLERALEEDVPISVLCSNILKSYQQGLKLVKERNGKNEFVITKGAIKNPEGFLNRLIKKSYES
jgi:hypothetical protein